MQKRIIFRLSDPLFAKVNEAIQKGKARNISELTRKALSEFLKTD
jgi:Arc/MetJ-type ribon-helix-helix transcriptional regulator